jgi:HEAT repeat protein
MKERTSMRLSGGNRVLLAIVAIALGSTTARSQDRTRSVVEGLQAREVDVRRTSANQVRLSARDLQHEALPVMIDLLMKEKDGQVRLAVFDSITMLGPDAEAAVPALVHTLRTNYGGQGQEESHQDYRAALALAAIGKPAVEGLRGLLKERKESVRSEVAMSLGRIGPDAEAAVPDLIPLLGDGSARVRREASTALGLIGPPAIEPLIAASRDRDVIIRVAAVEGLAALLAPDDRASRALVEATRDRAPEVRASALRSLSRLKLPEDVVVAIVRENLQHEDERVRLAVVRLLIEGRTLLSRMAPEFESLLTADQEGVARLAAFLLGKSGPDAAPRLLEALRRPGSRIEPIADGLAQIGRPAVEWLTRAIDDPNPRVRRGAALALGQIRPLAPSTAQKLTVGLADPDPEVRLAFLMAIGNLGPRAGESVPSVRVLLLDGSAKLRERAIEVLFQLAPRDERLIDDLTALFDDPDAKVQRRAIDTIRALGPPGRKALPVVLARLASEDPDVRFAAAQLVESHGPAATEAIPALTRLLTDSIPKVRMIASMTLGHFGKASQPAFPALAILLGDVDSAVREAAATALGSLELDAETIRPHLARALRDDKAEVRRAATRTIPRLGPQGVILVPDIILMAARKENLRSVDRLLRPFERSGPDVRSIPELVKQLEHDQVAVRLLAIKFLGLAGRNARKALPALERIREDPSTEVRERAKAAHEQIKNDAESGPQDDRARNPATTAPDARLS